MKKLILLTLYLVSTNVFAQSRNFKSFGGTVTISPIVGIERVQKFYPTPRMETRTIYGANLVYQLDIIGFEGEYTTANDTYQENATNKTYKDEDQKLKLGVRGSFRAGQFVNWYLRSGAQYRKTTTTITDNGSAAVTKDNTSKVQPYLGSGIEFRLLSMISLSADVTAVYTPTKDPNLSDYEIQPTVAFNLRF